MRTEVVTYQDDDLVVELTVSQATILIGLTRTRLKVEQSKVEEDNPDRRILRMVTYADLMACTVEAQGFDTWPISFDEFAELPEQLAIVWEDIVYRLNPHWLPGANAPEKKAPTTSTNG